MNKLSFLAFFAALTTSTAAYAHEYQLGELHLIHPHASSTTPGQTSGAAYFGIKNTGKNGDRLTAATSPIAKAVEFHTMSMTGNVMKMREVAHIDVTPATTIKMKPGEGVHLMLIGLKQPLKPGDKFPLNVSFEKSGKINLSVTVD